MVKRPASADKRSLSWLEINDRHAVHFTDFAVSSLIFGLCNNGSNTLRYRLRDITTPVRLMT